MVVVRVHIDAEHELNAVAEWYDAQRAGLGDKFLSAYGHILDTLEMAPQQGAPTIPFEHQQDAIRKLPFRRFPYDVVYAHDASSVLIVAIAHHRQLPGYWLKRLG